MITLSAKMKTMITQSISAFVAMDVTYSRADRGTTGL